MHDELIGRQRFLELLANFGILLGFVLVAAPANANSCALEEIRNYQSEILKGEPDFEELQEAAKCLEIVGSSAKSLRESQNNTIILNSAYVISNAKSSDIDKIFDDLIFSLKREDLEPISRRYIIYALGYAQTPRSEIVNSLVEILERDTDGECRGTAALALGNLKVESQAVLNKLINSIGTDHPSADDYVYQSVVKAISSYGVESEPYIPKLQLFLESTDYSSETRLAMGEAIATISLALYEDVTSQDNSFIRITEIRKVWETSRELRLLSDKLGHNLRILEFSKAEVPELAVSYDEVERYKALIDSRQRDLVLGMARQSFGGVGQVAVTHGLVWLALIFAYPRSPMVQTAFFWNPRIRRILGFPYVTEALKWVPCFRNILFIPFRDALRSDANLDLFKGQSYFSNLMVKANGWSQSQPIDQVIPKLKGRVVLQGESGSGKSMFLRYLLSQSSRIAVYLPAQKCDQGVIAAIQAKLYGQAQDADFLRDLIYSGAIDIYIDGLNEVTPDTRAGIKEFVEKNFKGNIILTTQPLEWQPPGQIYNLQPLNIEQISDFLRQQPMADAATYGQACADYLCRVEAELTAETVPVDEKVALRQSLSNPMDLTVVAQLLDNQKHPDLLRLREQQYATMAEDYQRIYLGRSFPLKTFSEMAYRLRLESQVQIPEADFGDELLCLERHKMVVRRQRAAEGRVGLTQWFFRHEKVADFFVAQAFLQATDDRQTQHFADSRFRGVYLLLATLLPEPQKMALREQLIQYAACHNDHLLSDAFVRRVGSPKRGPGLPA